MQCPSPPARLIPTVRRAPRAAQLGVAVAALALMSSPIGEAFGEAFGEPGEQGFTGTWAYAGDDAEATRRKKAIEAATEGMAPFMRGKARERLGVSTSPPKILKIRVEGENLELARDGKLVSLRLGGPATTVERAKKAEMSARRDGERLIVESKGENGEQVTTYTLSPDAKHLTASVRMRSEKLEKPLVYTSTFARK